MSPMDWNRLAPQRPLGVGDVLRVERPWRSGEQLAAMVKNRMGPIALTGPSGSGKSSELAAAAKGLQSDFVAVMVPLDRLMDVRQLEEGALLQHLGSRIIHVASSVLNLSLTEASRSAGETSTAARGGAFLGLLREVARKSRQGRVALLLDGLERCPREVARNAIQALLPAREEADLILVVPLELVTGPDGHEVLGELRPYTLRPMPVVEEEGAEWQAGRRFLREVFMRRMGLTVVEGWLEELLERAVRASSGMPRTFLQLMKDAGGYASVAGKELPELQHLEAAIADQQEALQRLLRDGDVAALREAEGSSGVEMPLERRLRLLSQGLLLEYDVKGRVLVRANRLLPEVRGVQA